jgi:predicted amidohydrolase
MKRGTLTIATSQFPVTEHVKGNLAYMLRHIKLASNKRADVIHFPELSLTGYETANKDIEWEQVQSAINTLKVAAIKKKITIIFGVHEQVERNIKSYNCTYVISTNGELIGKYIKSKLYKQENKIFTTKQNDLVLMINRIRCGFLICYDSCFPELYKNYRKRGVQLLFHSYYNAKSTKSKNSLDVLMKSQLVTRAADNKMYISGSNSSVRYSRMAASFAYPDGTIRSLRRHIPGILVSRYPAKQLGWTYDNSK